MHRKEKEKKIIRVGAKEKEKGQSEKDFPRKLAKEKPSSFECENKERFLSLGWEIESLALSKRVELAYILGLSRTMRINCCMHELFPFLDKFCVMSIAPCLRESHQKPWTTHKSLWT